MNAKTVRLRPGCHHQILEWVSDDRRHRRSSLVHRTRDDVWNDGQADWVSLASSARLITVDRTGHNIQIDRPDVVLDKIQELLQ